MKHFTRYSTTAVMAFLLFSCTESDYYYKDFIGTATRLYVGKVDSVKIHPGRNRIKLSWLLSPDQSVKSTRIYWNNGKDSLVQPMIRVQGVDTSEAIIARLEEGNYAFTIFTHDDKGNRSVGVEVFARAYGDTYEGNLSNRVIEGMTPEADSVSISWFDEFSETLRATEISFENEAGDREYRILPANKNLIVIHGVHPGDELEYRSLHLPDSLAIDTFYSSAAKLIIE